LTVAYYVDVETLTSFCRIFMDVEKPLCNRLGGKASEPSPGGRGCKVRKVSYQTEGSRAESKD
jgi:hypothetical protein